MISILDIFNNLYVVNNLQIISSQSLAAEIANAHKNVLSLLRMRDSSDQFRLTITQCYVFLFLHIIESDSAHSTAMANIPPGEIETGDGIGEASLY